MNIVTYALTRIPQFLYDRMKNYGRNVIGSDVVMVVIAKDDPSGALTIPSGFELRNLFTRQVKFVYRTVSTLKEIDDFASQLKKRDNRIHGLWIKAHGECEGIGFGPDFTNETYMWIHNPTKTFPKRHLRTTFDSLEKEALIILNSCKTANKKCGVSIAEHIHKLSRRTVFAPKHSVTSGGTKITFDGRHLKATFLKRKNLGNPFLNFFNFLIFPYLSYFGTDITAEIK